METPLAKSKDFLERFWDLMHKKSTGTNFIAELDELAQKVQASLDEVYEAENELSTLRRFMRRIKARRKSA